MITFLLIVINCLIFYFCNMQLYNNELNQFFVAYGLNEFTMHNPTNWVTSMFLHGGVAHIAMNMAVLFQCGMILESSMNRIFYLILYFICGLAGSFASVLFIQHTGEVVNVIGASGAIFGLLAYSAVATRSFSSFLLEAAIFHAIVYAFSLPIAWFAHLGGAVAGAVFGLIFGLQSSKQSLRM